MRTRTILLASLMIMMSCTPLVTADYNKEIEQGKELNESTVFDFPAKTIDAFGQELILAHPDVHHAALSKQMEAAPETQVTQQARREA